MDESRIKQAAEAEPGEILRVRREKLAALQEAGKDPFTVTRYGQTHHARQIIDGFESHESKPVCVAGRLMSKRVMGKMSFAHLLDEQGQIQLGLKRDVLGEEAYGAFKALDIGDIVGAEGAVFRTNAGEVSVLAERVQLLSKSLLPLPEKFHGLKDNDLRYRQRYVDLMVNPEVRAAFVKRSRVISAMRRFLDGLGFLEVETPVLNTIIGGASARPFITHHNTLDIDMYMRIALELHLKRLVVGGFERVYEIGRVFRNEGMSTRHNPEFTIMELYQAYTDYNGMMELTESIFAHCAGEVLGTLQISYQGEPIDLTPPFRRLSMNDAVKEAVGADFAACADDMQARALAESLKLDVKKTDTKGKLLSLAFEEFAEHKLIQPTFVTDHPVDISPLAKRRQDAPWLTERFELFIYGREHANAFSELNDPIDQRQRFEQQARQRAAGDEEAQMMDEDFVTALEYGLPPTGGLGIGVDRMVMLLTDAASIRDVLLFPTMKPLGK